MSFTCLAPLGQVQVDELARRNPPNARFAKDLCRDFSAKNASKRHVSANINGT
jgi:hypothetical protein